jgi:hypothetical protein
MEALRPVARTQEVNDRPSRPRRRGRASPRKRGARRGWRLHENSSRLRRPLPRTRPNKALEHGNSPIRTKQRHAFRQAEIGNDARVPDADRHLPASLEAGDVGASVNLERRQIGEQFVLLDRPASPKPYPDRPTSTVRSGRSRLAWRSSPARIPRQTFRTDPRSLASCAAGAGGRAQVQSEATPLGGFRASGLNVCW